MSRTRSSNSKQNNSNYQSLYLWANFLLGMISLGIVVWNRKSLIPAQAGIQSSFPEFLDSRLCGNDNSISAYQINFPSFFSSLALSALTYQLSGNPVVGLLSNYHLFLAKTISMRNLFPSNLMEIPRFVRDDGVASFASSMDLNASAYQFS